MNELKPFLINNLRHTLYEKHVHIYPIHGNKIVCGILQHIDDDYIRLESNGKSRFILTSNIFSIVEAEHEEVCPISKVIEAQFLEGGVPQEFFEVKDYFNKLLAGMSLLSAHQFSQLMNKIAACTSNPKGLVEMVNEALTEYIKENRLD